MKKNILAAMAASILCLAGESFSMSSNRITNVSEKINTMNAATDVPLENEEIFPEKTVADVLAKKSSILHPQVHQAIFSDE